MTCLITPPLFFLPLCYSCSLSILPLPSFPTCRIWNIKHRFVFIFRAAVSVRVCVYVCVYSICLCVSVYQMLIHTGLWAVWLCLGASLCVCLWTCQGCFFQVNPLRRGVVLSCALCTPSPLCSSLWAQYHHMLSRFSPPLIFFSYCCYCCGR